MYFWINFLLWNLGTLWFGLFFSLALEPRWDKVPRWVLAVSFSVIVLPSVYLKILHPLSTVLYLTAFVSLLMYVLAAFKDRLWKKLLLFILFCAVAEISELPLRYLAGYTGMSFDGSFNSLKMVLLVAAETGITLILTSLLLITWNRFAAHKKTVRYIYIFLIFPISQLIMLFAFGGIIPETTSIDCFFACIGVSLGLIADFILLYVIVEQGQKEVLAGKLHELEMLHRIEDVHYQAIEARRNKMAKLRHDFNNQLITAYHMVEQENTESARALLDALKADIATTSEYTYCGNAVVNAVLSEKAAASQAQGILLETELDLGEEPNIKPVHLCSIFSNLLDNAMHAVKSCPESERFITVKAARKEDYLYIKVENSSVEPKKVHSDRKGYGQEILCDIAFQYDGEFLTEWKDGVYRAMLSLSVI